MTGDQTPIAAEADIESLRDKLRAMTETLTPSERSILEALLRASGRPTDDEVEGYWSLSIPNPFGGTVSIGTRSVAGYFGFDSSPGPQVQVVRRDRRSGSNPDPRSQRHTHE